MIRIGHGYDAHSFEPGKQLVLGGVSIQHEQGLKAHSDGDVVIHALCDALIGAAGLGDIGKHFPDTDAEFKNIDSRILLRNVVATLQEKQLRAGNVDITIIAQVPKLAPYIDQMRDTMAMDLQIDASCCNVKATTTEGMGFTGRGEGIAAHAVALLASR